MKTSPLVEKPVPQDNKAAPLDDKAAPQEVKDALQSKKPALHSEEQPVKKSCFALSMSVWRSSRRLRRTNGGHCWCPKRLSWMEGRLRQIRVSLLEMTNTNREAEDQIRASQIEMGSQKAKNSEALLAMATVEDATLPELPYWTWSRRPERLLRSSRKKGTSGRRREPP